MGKSGLQYTIALFDLEFIEYDRLCGCVVLLYVRKQHDHVFTALILDSPTVHSLLQAVRIADVLLTIDIIYRVDQKLSCCTVIDISEARQ